VLKGHAHNFTGMLESPDRRPQSRLLRRAEHYIEEHASRPITLSVIAAELNTSVRTLQARFREGRQTTPASYLRSVRLQRARQALVEANVSTTVTDVALNYGFLHLGRFSQYYKATFGETPVATLTRVRGLRRKHPN
jgi:transcriptional regulator GlxA family with amidase domain